MNKLLKINYEAEQPTVSARDLHEQLNIKTAFKDWFPRMCEYGFEEGKDFCSKMSETSSKGGRPSKDADISIDMAKQICMIQRSPEGKQIRQYFIDLEKAWNTPEQIMARALKMANHSIESLKGRCKFLGEQVVEQQQIITELQPNGASFGMWFMTRIQKLCMQYLMVLKAEEFLQNLWIKMVSQDYGKVNRNART